MDFEWDESKRLSILRKHGIDFLDAALVFGNETIEWIDESEDYGEERVIALGRLELTVLRITYTSRSDAIRIISAQRANKHDQKNYYNAIKPR